MQMFCGHFIRLVIVLFLVLSMSIECRKNNRNYTVEIRNGIKHINNMFAKWGNTPKINLKFIKSFGEVSSRSGSYQLPGIQDFCMDKNGNLYIIDGTNQKIIKYSRDGKVLYSFDTSINIPYCIEIDENDYIYIGDRTDKSIGIFNRSGVEQKTISLGGFLDYFWHPGDFRLLKDGRLLIYGEISTIPSKYLKGYSNHIFKFINNNGELSGGFFDAEFYEYRSSSVHSNKVLFDMGKNGDIFISYKFRNRIIGLNSIGEIMFSTSRPINFSETDFSIEDEKLVYPNQISKSICVDHKERIWICTINRELDDFESRGKYDSNVDHLIFHIFNKDGIFLGNIPVRENFQKMRIFENRLFLINRQRSGISEYQIIEN